MNIIFENTKTFWFAKFQIYIAQRNDFQRKEKILEKVVLNIKKGDIVSIFFFFFWHIKMFLSDINLKRILRTFALVNLLKTHPGFCPNVENEMTLNLVLGKAFP